MLTEKLDNQVKEQTPDNQDDAIREE